ncbi:MAG: peptidylprolyl isomerase [Candidatus Velthaea sp.]
MVALAGSLAGGSLVSASDLPGYRRLIELESARTYSAELVLDLNARDPALAARAALALGRTKDPRAAAPLVRRLRTAADPGVRAMAVYGLGLVADRTAVDPAPVARALADGAGVVRTAAVDAAQRLASAKRPAASGLIARLSALMRNDPDPIVRGRAAVAMAAFAGTAAAGAAGSAVSEAYGRERDVAVRRHQAWTLGRAFPKAPGTDQVLAGLLDADDVIRIEFLIVAGRRDDPALVESMQPLGHDPSWRVAEQALESIKRIAGGGRTEHLTAVPVGVVTPAAQPAETSAPVPRPFGLGAPQRPAAADALVALPLHPLTSAALDGPVRGPHPRVRIATTQGPMVVRLYPEWAPLTVANFLGLVNRGFFDGLRWFRIVPDFVAQTGDPKNTGEGEPGYTVPGEENPLEQRAGVISMGLNYQNNEAVRDSAGTQFYITMSPQYHLNRAFTVFGEVESGFDVLGRLTESDTMTKVEQILAD